MIFTVTARQPKTLPTLYLSENLYLNAIESLGVLQNLANRNDLLILCNSRKGCIGERKQPNADH